MFAATSAPLTLSHPTDGGVAPSSVVVAVTDRRSGTTIVDDVAVNPGSDHTIPAGDMPDEPTILDVVWTLDNDWVVNHVVTVTPQLLVDPDQLTVGDRTHAAAATERIEEAIRRATTPRWGRTTRRSDAAGLIHFDQLAPIREVLTVTNGDGNPVAVDEVHHDAAVVVLARGLEATTVTVEFTYGMDRAPSALADAAATAADQLAKDRASKHRPPQGEYPDGISWLVSNPSPKHKRWFGIPDVDAVIALHEGGGVFA